MVIMARKGKAGKKVNLPSMIALFFVFLIALIGGWIFLTNFNQNPGNNTNPSATIIASPTTQPTPNYPPELYARLKFYQDTPTADAKRPSYFGSITDEIFKELPAFPKDFYIVKLLFELGKVTDPTKITSEYYKQPEFYPQFESQGVQMMSNPPQGRWGAFGYGTYPSETVVLTPRQGEFQAGFFFYTSWIVQTYQGLSLTTTFPSRATLMKSYFPDNTQTVIQDPAIVSKYFEVSVSPNVLLLEPAFPVFKSNWAQQIIVTVKVKNPPPGKYAISLYAGDPPSDKGNEWLWKYKNNYVGGTAHSIGAPMYSIFIEV